MRRAERGVTMTELLVSLAIVLIVAAGVVRLAIEAQAFFRMQPELADLTQRARAGVDLLLAELTSASAGPSFGPDAGPLVRWLPPVLPFRYQGTGAVDPPGRIFTDRITLIAAIDELPAVSVRGAMRARDEAIPILAGPGCPVSDVLCGFRDGQRLIVFDRTPAFELATVRDALPGLFGMAYVHHEPRALTKPYREADGAHVLRVRAVTYAFDAARRQVRRALGPRNDAPVLDDVVGLSFRYFGDRAPPAHPRPPAGEASCLFDEHGVSRLAALAANDGEQVELTEAHLTDGPFCGAAGGVLFDADLYRVRRVRVTLRLQASSSTVRGIDALLFRHPGTATDPRVLVPDFIMTFDVVPRNVQEVS